MKTNKFHSDGGTDDLDAAIADAVRRNEELHIMQDKETGRYHQIRPHGHKHWQQHYVDVAHITIKPQINLLGAAPDPTRRPDLRPSTLDVIAERTRQIVDLGHDATHDDEASDDGDLACAAASYALNAGCQLNPQAQAPLDEIPTFWPGNWANHHWKPKDARRDLVRAGALILAEIDRIDRQQAKATS